MADSNLTTTNRVFKGALALVLCSLQIFDIFSTVRALHHGAVELNPLFIVAGAFNIERLLLVKFVALLCTCVLVLRTSKIRPETQLRRLTLYAMFYFVVCWSNWSI